MKQKYNIALLLNANKAYDRQIIEGITEYLYATSIEWGIFLDEDFITKPFLFKDWSGDGIIADVEDPEIIDLIRPMVSIPIIGIGLSYASDLNVGTKIPCIASDDYALINEAFSHLQKKGLQHFAFFGLPTNSWKKWGHARENAFKKIMKENELVANILSDFEYNPKQWEHDIEIIFNWIKRLPKPVGIIAASDSRARYLLSACEKHKIIVPDIVSIIGIDNDEVARYLSRLSLSSVSQSCKQIGYEAAKLLHQKLSGPSFQCDGCEILVKPNNVISRQTTDFRSVKDPYVIQAVNYIRQFSSKGIKTIHVLDALRISKTNLELRFNNELGHSIHHEIHASKLKKACDLLSTTQLPISDIATLCGYRTVQYMYKTFNSSIKKTPKEYREENSKR